MIDQTARILLIGGGLLGLLAMALVPENPFWALGVLCLVFFAAWVVSLVKSDVGVIDVLWGPAFFIAGLSWAIQYGASGQRAAIAMVLVFVWAARLAWHIGKRNAGKAEDRRYQRMREEAGRGFWWQSLLTIFLLQAVLAFVCAAPLYAIARNPEPLSVMGAIGVILWAIGLAFEAGADWQLARFQQHDNEGEVLRSGFWGLSRHPNYFGEFLMWWGIYLLALPEGWWSLFGPVLLSIMLLRVSGVSLTESDIAERRPAYRTYRKEVPAFFPRWRLDILKRKVW